MSTHAMIAAAYLGHPATTKLVLMALADSCDEHTHIAAPGLPKLRAWSGVSKSQVLRIVAQLEAEGTIRQDQPGRKGRRATWLVFPDGVPGIPHPSEVAARYASLSPPVDDAPSPVDNSPSEGRTGATQTDSQGRMSAAQGRIATRPLQSSTSVNRPPGPTTHTPPPVDRRGFPGSRATATADKPTPVPPRPLCPEHGLPGATCQRCEQVANPAGAAQARAAIADHRKTHPTRAKDHRP